MDSIRIVVFLLTNMITLHYNLAESGDSDVAIPEAYTTAGTSTTQPMLRRFEWRHLDGRPVAKRQRRSDSFESDDEDLDNVKPKAVYFIPTQCDPETERGYTCLACGESLHCMGGGFGLKAICYGRRPFCFNGVCSNTRGEKCNKEADLVVAANIANSTNSGAAAGDAAPPQIAPRVEARRFNDWV